MTIPQPLQKYCDAFMYLLVSTPVAPGLKWWQSLYTEINHKSLNQCWYEHAIVFPIPGNSTEFCVELNYESKLGLRCAYGIRKDKPKKHKYDVSLVAAFKRYSDAPYFEAVNYSSYNPQERLDPDHWIVWRFMPLPLSNKILLVEDVSNDIVRGENLKTIESKAELLIDDINLFFSDWRNSEC